MLKEWEREYFRENEGSKAQIWLGNLSLEVGDLGVAVVDHGWKEHSEAEPEEEKWTLAEPDEREVVRNRWKSTWILLDTYR